MCRTEIFAGILEAVSRETEIPASLILSPDRKTETVDARYIVVELCFRCGMYPSSIAEKVGLTVRAVNRILSVFKDRMSGNRIMRMDYMSVRKILGNDPEAVGK